MPKFKLKGHWTYWNLKKRGPRGLPQMRTEPHEILYEAESEDAIRKQLRDFKWTVDSIRLWTPEDEERAWQGIREDIDCHRAHVCHNSEFKSWSDQLTLPATLILAAAYLGFVASLVMMEIEGHFLGNWIIVAAGSALFFWLGMKIDHLRDQFASFGNLPISESDAESANEPKQ